jgi:hypothetical protein
MKALSVLSFVIFESSKDSTSALLAAITLVLKGTFPPELLSSETLKGFHDLCDSYRVPAHTKVLSILKFSVAQISKGLNPFLSLRWRIGCPLGSLLLKQLLVESAGYSTTL